MEFLREALRKVPEYTTLLGAVNSGHQPVLATGLSRIHKANLIDTLPADTNQRALVIVSDEGDADRVAEDLKSMGRSCAVFPARDLCIRPIEGFSREFEQQRVGVLSQILNNEFDIVIAPVDAVMSYTVPKELLCALLCTIRPGDELDISLLSKQLLFSGYSRVQMVEAAGQFAIRGGIMDIFVPASKNPVRIEFWDDEIDTVCEFDVATQRRMDTLQSVTVAPAREVLFESNEVLLEKIQAFAMSLNRKHEAAKTIILREADMIKDGVLPANIDKYIPLCYTTPHTLFDYMSGADVFVYEPSKVNDRVRSFLWQQGEDIEGYLKDGTLCRGLDKLSLSSSELTYKLENSRTVMLESFTASAVLASPKQIVNFRLLTTSPWGGMVSELTDEINTALKRKFAVVVLAGSERAAYALCDELSSLDIKATYHNEPNLKSGTVSITTGGLSSGIEYTDSKVAVFTHSRSSSGAKKRRLKHYKNAGAAIGSLEELKKGEPVVHAVYGIGIFDGINKIETQGVIKDYIKIRFMKDDVLYVPVTQLDLVSRYIGGGDETTVKLSRLGSDQWIKTKTRVKSAVKDMAKELIALYSKRMQAKGFAFSEDTDLQHDFEYHFPYDETDDQLRCCEEIKQDMQRSAPMERLLCGDVGFGKTEVALRAAFKCVCDGKQVAILVPTTILAWQHYKTLTARMEHFAVNCEMLSRFRTASQQTKIKKDLQRGNIDIIVGTHRLISQDIKFRDLGLLIVDEEQRFGVAQKEKLKQSFPNVDVLTLSATPIPRTLNMAMSGIRDMSVIEEAPQDRKPVQTYVLEHDNGVIIDAIRKELARGGQVYYIYNRVETIDLVAARLKANLPDAEIAIAHGQMSEEELSEKWRLLLDGDIDVLVCTTIIETGVDVPNVNTMIIENADRFGLSQLHQLRGRVGRSTRRAYAYMTFKRGKALSDVATKRLEAIREYTEFGSGFKIAMRDLEIRGAGNILGAKQHGHMDSVGYDMYVKLLSDAIKEEKGEVPQHDNECAVDLHINAHIPESYIESLPARLQIYRRIAEIKTDEHAEDVMDELIDRFGEPPVAVLGLIDIALLRNRASEMGIYDINDKNGGMVIYFKEFSKEIASKLMAAPELKGRVMLSYSEKPYITIRMKKEHDPLDTLKCVLDILQY